MVAVLADQVNPTIDHEKVVVTVKAEAPSVTTFVLPEPASVKDAQEKDCPAELNVPVVRVMALVTVKVFNRVSDRSDLLIVTDDATAGFVLTVTVAVVPELLSKLTVSDDVGTDAPLEPPDVADQCDVSEASQVPVPPTQYLLAI